MKVFLTLISILFSIPLFTQCDFTNYDFRTQAEIDSFSDREPDCEHILGFVSVRNADVISVEGLSQIKSVSGDLTISSTSLKDLSGFENLVTTRKLSIIANNQLENLDSLENLYGVFADLIILSNSSLENINGLSQIHRLYGKLFVSGNNLTEISGSDNLASMEGIEITEENNLREVNGFNGLINISDSVNFNKCDSLYSIKGFSQLGKIDHDFSIADIPVPIRLEGFSSLDTIGDDFAITNSIVDSTVSMLENLSIVEGGFSILSNDLDGVVLEFRSLFSVRGSLKINSNTKPFKIGLNRLRFVRNQINISTNMDLLDVAGFDNLFGHLSSLSISGNRALKNISGFNFLRITEGLCEIGSNLNLERITGFSTILEADILELNINPKLKFIEGFNNLETINQSLVILSNEGLLNLDAFRNLNQIRRTLVISNCDALVDITGLTNVDPLSLEQLRIESNPSLSYCHINSVCGFLTGFNTDYSIDGNKEGCVNVEQVLGNCRTTSIEQTIEHRHSIFPNPVTSHLQIEEGGFEYYKIYNVDTSLEQEGPLQGNTIDVSSLSPGLYILSFQNEESTYNHKFVKSD